MAFEGQYMFKLSLEHTLAYNGTSTDTAEQEGFLISSSAN